MRQRRDKRCRESRPHANERSGESISCDRNATRYASPRARGFLFLRMHAQLGNECKFKSRREANFHQVRTCLYMRAEEDSYNIRP